MRRQISKGAFYHNGGFANPHQYRRMIGHRIQTEGSCVMTRYIETVDGFGILFDAHPEETSMRQHFIKECGWTESEYRKIKDYAWFSAEVSAWKNGEELASKCLGPCCYETIEEFYTTYHDDYFAQMVQEVVTEAKRVERGHAAEQTNV